MKKLISSIVIACSIFTATVFTSPSTPDPAPKAPIVSENSPGTTITTMGHGVGT